MVSENSQQIKHHRSMFLPSYKVPPLSHWYVALNALTPTCTHLLAATDWHLEAGLAVVFAEAPAEQRSGPFAQIIKQEWLDLCPIYNALPPELQ
jgi:hypothetical protein